jgi:hypothetical protein
MAVVCNNCLTLGTIAFLVTLYILVGIHAYLFIKYVIRQKPREPKYVGSSTYEYKLYPQVYSDSGNQVEGKDVAVNIIREVKREIKRQEDAAAEAAKIEEAKKPWTIRIKSA